MLEEIRPANNPIARKPMPAIIAYSLKKGAEIILVELAEPVAEEIISLIRYS